MEVSSPQQAIAMLSYLTDAELKTLLAKYQIMYYASQVYGATASAQTIADVRFIQDTRGPQS